MTCPHAIIGTRARQDENPRDVTFREKIPDEVLQQGWLPVLKYLRELGDRPAAVAETRLIFTGDGEQGKTSLMRALLDHARSVCPRIDERDRTVGAEIHAGWQPGGPGGPTLHLVDLAGQGVYGAGHAAILTLRCLSQAGVISHDRLKLMFFALLLMRWRKSALMRPSWRHMCCAGALLCCCSRRSRARTTAK